MEMNHKFAGKLTGIAFIIGTAAGIASIPFMSIIYGERYLVDIYNQPTRLIVGGLLVMLMGIACASIAYWIYPILSQYRKSLAIAAVGFRTIEGGITLLVSIMLLTLIPLSRNYAFAGSAAVLASGDLLIAMQQSISPILGIIFSVGALMYSIGFYQTKLVPTYLSIWGILAAIMHITASLMLIFGFDSVSLFTIALNLPIAVQEMVLAVYLIRFGFRAVSPQ